MKIAVVVCSYPPYQGGIGNAAARQSAALREAGHQVVVMCPAHNDPAGRTMVDGIEVLRLPSWPRFGVSAFMPSVAARLRGFDALYLHYPFYGGAEAAVLGAAIHGIPYVVYFHMDVLASGLRGFLVRAYERTVAPWILRSARKVLVSTLDYARHASIGRLGLMTMEELRFGVDTELFAPGAVDDRILQEMGLDPSLPTVLFVGGMDSGHAFKGIPVLIDAMSGLRADEAQLVLVGDGDLRPGFELLALEKCAVPFHFAGSASSTTLKTLYRAATVTVLPSTSREEAFGIVLIESMASGTPVIASDLPGVRTVADEQSGMLVQVGDVAGLRSAIRLFVGDPHRSSLMGAAARKRALEIYSRQREWTFLAREAFGGFA